jgi:uncharacterized metal-binding protein
VGCAKAILKNAQVPLNHYLVLTDEGIEKNKNFKLERSDIDLVKTAVKRDVGQSSIVEGSASESGCNCKSCC